MEQKLRVRGKAGKECAMYRQMVREYFKDYLRGSGCQWFLWLIPWAAIAAQWFPVRERAKGWPAAVPILAAVISAFSHKVSLPFMMYLLPLSKTQREAYMERMLRIKVLVPLAFALLWDAIFWCAGRLSAYAFFLQIPCVVTLSYLYGMLHESNAADEERLAFGGLRWFVPVILVVTLFGALVMCAVCAGEIRTVEFVIVLAVFLAVFLPITGAVRRRWGLIKGNFADYGKAFETESAARRW